MDFKQIQELITLVNDSNIGEVSIEQKDFKIIIKQKEEPVTQFLSAPSPAPSVYQPQQTAQPSLLSSATGNQQQAPAASSTSTTALTIKSPMIGTFYRRSSPDKPNFVEIGDSVTVGTVVCIIEAMKLFNEIESEVSGKIVKLLVEDASPVEYDQPLYLVEPS